MNRLMTLLKDRDTEIHKNLVIRYLLILIITVNILRLIKR